MQYNIKIIAQNGQSVSLVSENDSTNASVKFCIAAKEENTKERKDDLVATMTIIGPLNDSEKGMKEATLELLKWSKAIKKEEAYRTVEAELSQNNEIYRVYKVPEMFVVSYTEHDENFELRLCQKTGNIGKIDEFAG